MKPRLLPYGTGLAILLGLSVLPRAPRPAARARRRCCFPTHAAHSCRRPPRAWRIPSRRMLALFMTPPRTPA